MMPLSSELPAKAVRALPFPSQIGAGSYSARNVALPAAVHSSELVPAWNKLAERSIFPSLQAGAAWTGNMVAALKPASNGPLLLEARRPSDGALIGIAAMERSVFPPMLRTWNAPLMFSGTPLIDAGAAHEAIFGMLSAARRGHGVGAVLFRRTEADTPLSAAFDSLARDAALPIARFDKRECAALEVTSSFEEWFEKSFPRKRRKEYRRLRSRLAETGHLVSETLQPSDCLDSWIEDFLALEQSGWKGRRGTAIGCDAPSARFLKDALADLACRGELLFWRLSLDNSPIAMLFALVGQERAWLVKMAYDEDYARYSPGVLITLDATQSLIERGDVRFVDSCAVPNHPMIDHIWHDRLPVEDVLIATPGTSLATFRLIASAEQARRKLRSVAKSLYHRYKSLKGE